MSNLVLSYMSKWFSANELLLNLNQTNIMTFIGNNLPHCALSSSIGCKGKCTEGNVSKKFFVLQIYNWLIGRF